jgi:hypothetical protein
MSLLLSAAALSALLAATPVELAPGAALGEALQIERSETARYGLNGAPPGARGALPAAPDRPGAHYLVVYAEDGTPQRWLRFVVSGNAAEAPALALPVDRQPPELKVIAEATVEREGQRYAGPSTALRVEADDPSGLQGEPSLHVDGQPISDPTQPDLPAMDRELSIVARASDALGNAGESPVLNLRFDRTPPALGAQRASQREGVPADVVAPGESILLQLGDAGAGLGSLTLAGQELTLDGSAAQTLTLPMPSSTEYRLSDRLGNVAHAALPLRLDDAAPRLLLVSDGLAQPASDGARLPRSERLELVAEDPLAGVARACVELSIWYDQCRPLPITLVGIDPGRYRLVFRATDRLGHKASERFEIEVLR